MVCSVRRSVCWKRFARVVKLRVDSGIVMVVGAQVPPLTDYSDSLWRESRGQSTVASALRFSVRGEGTATNLDLSKNVRAKCSGGEACESGP
jgi:hypothetical protein